ncbi:tyrosine-type recombinase/integrase [Rugosibacter aromaticivorans]|uniref:tyrosine-type recombinase/integrase n=1 Tax=Rugosibacter aromaticivorans TaxID=1565605 RepID=UPI001216FD21|nr:tyrosine-type recombinase/integrase [Rugosibacter aromaticivorans]TBR13105.1 MAG: hypothetical protein EPO43_11640 [Rugosibacter sp.]
MPCFASQKKRVGLTRSSASLNGKGALQRAGIEGFTWHGLRHTWAAWHAMSGTPLDVLQKLGGWADHKMVLQYAHLAPEYLASFANNAKPWKARKKDAA